jgi:Flp pilus assembly pilin Flp
MSLWLRSGVGDKEYSANHREEKQPMTKLAAAARNFAIGEEGATLVEYSLLVALLAAASIAILYGFGQNIKGIYSQTNTAVSTANEAITTAS